MARKKKKLNKGLILSVLAGLLISIMLASSQISKGQSMNTFIRATETQSCVSQVYTYHGTGICIDNIKLICKNTASPEKGINCTQDGDNPKVVHCDFGQYNKQARSCVNPTTLKSMIRAICGCPDISPIIPFPSKGDEIEPPPGQPY